MQDVETSARITSIEERLKQLEEQPSRHEFLTTLSPSSLRLKQNIPVSIATNGEDFIATFFDAQISATGDTAAEAVWNLRDVLVLKFNRLNELPPNSLGSAISKQFAILKEFIAKRELS